MNHEYTDYLQLNRELRNSLNMKMKARRIKRLELAERLEMKIGDLGRVLKTNDKEEFERKLSVKMLDIITEMLGLEEGHYYPMFIGELRRRPTVRKDEPRESASGNGSFMEEKTKEFIKRCLELEKYSLVSQLIAEILKEKSIRFIFELAEELFDYAEKKYPYSPDTLNYSKPEYKQALYLYEAVIGEEKRLGEILAVSYFRKFYMLRLDQSIVHELFPIMKIFIPYLPDTIRLAALERVCGYYSTYFKWDELLRASYRLEELAIELDDEDRRGFALISRGIAYAEKYMYPEAFSMIERYKDIEGFQGHALGNYLLTLVKSGDMSRVNELIERALTIKSPARESMLAVIVEKLYESDNLELAMKLIQHCQENNLIVEELDKSYITVSIMRYKKAEGLVLLKTGDGVRGMEEILYSAKLALFLNQTQDFGQLVNIFRNNITHATKEQMDKLFDLLERR